MNARGGQDLGRLLVLVALLVVAGCIPDDSVGPTTPKLGDLVSTQVDAPVPKDVGPVALDAGDACDPSADQCGADLSCYTQYPAMDAWTCRASGTLARHASCDRAEACAPGSVCINDDGFIDAPRCMEVCIPGAKDCGSGQYCMPEEPMRSDAGEKKGGVHAFGLCVDRCTNPVGNVGCGDGFTCTSLGEPFGDATVCMSAGARPLGGACNLDMGQCAAGLHCALGRCSEPCAGSCSDGETCFEVPEDGVAVCATACDPASPNCSDGLGCRPHPKDPTKGACGIVGSAGPHQPCSTSFDCTIGLSCVMDDTERGLCQIVCSPSEAGTCGAGERCVPEPSDFVIPGICRAPCTSLAGNDCPKGFTCLSTDVGGAPVCVEGGNTLEGESCNSEAGECAPGLVCAHRCLRPCSVGAESCESGEVCAEFDGDPVGYCLSVCESDTGCPTGFGCDQLSETDRRVACTPVSSNPDDRDASDDADPEDGVRSGRPGE
jgi:hypothetical protein